MPSPTPNCTECRGDPRGVFLLNGYVSCNLCGGDQGRTVLGTLGPKEAQALLDDLEAAGEGSSYRKKKLDVTLPGASATGCAIAWKSLWVLQRLGRGQSRHRAEYVDERVLDDGIHIFVHYGKSWTSSTTAGKRGTYNSEILFVHKFHTEEGAMNSIGPAATRNPK